MAINLISNIDLSALAGESNFTSSAWFFVILFIIVLLIVWLLLILNAKQSQKEVDELAAQIQEEEDEHQSEPDDKGRQDRLGKAPSQEREGDSRSIWNHPGVSCPG